MLFTGALGPRLAIGWTMGAVVSAVGVYLSFRLDLPTGATIVGTFGAALLISGYPPRLPAARRPERRRFRRLRPVSRAGAEADSGPGVSWARRSIGSSSGDSTAPHNHSFDELLGGPSAAAGEQAVTTHDPHSRASHWHAVIRFVKENPCLACQWHRLSGASSVRGLMRRPSSSPRKIPFRPSSDLPPSASPPRAPPDLL